MDTAVGSSVLTRGFRLALTVEGLKPHPVDNYVRDVECFASHHQDLLKATSTDVRAYILTLQESRSPKTVYETQLGSSLHLAAHESQRPASTGPLAYSYGLGSTTMRKRLTLSNLSPDMDAPAFRSASARS